MSIENIDNIENDSFLDSFEKTDVAKLLSRFGFRFSSIQNSNRLLLTFVRNDETLPDFVPYALANRAIGLLKMSEYDICDRKIFVYENNNEISVRIEIIIGKTLKSDSNLIDEIDVISQDLTDIIYNLKEIPKFECPIVKIDKDSLKK